MHQICLTPIYKMSVESPLCIIWLVWWSTKRVECRILLFCKQKSSNIAFFSSCVVRRWNKSRSKIAFTGNRCNFSILFFYLVGRKNATVKPSFLYIYIYLLFHLACFHRYLFVYFHLNHRLCLFHSSFCFSPSIIFTIYFFLQFLYAKR